MNRMHEEPSPERRPIRTILLVGSGYDAYILREAGFPSADEQRRGERGAFGPRPVFFHATSVAAGLRVLAEHNAAKGGATGDGVAGAIDLVITDLEHPDGDAFSLGREVRQRYPGLPIVLLTSKQHYGRSRVLVAGRDDVDRIFVWHGHSDIVSALVHCVEDARNLDHDMRHDNLRFILLVEDEPNVHSRFLPLIYREVREMTRNLLSPRLRPEEQARRMRDRARVILVETYEDAVAPLDRYPHNVLGVISDIQYPRHGRIDPTAGLSLVRRVKRRLGDVPVIIQSREQDLRGDVERSGAAFICKHSAHLLETLRKYLRMYFGFGDFVFREPKTGKKIATAGTLRELREVTARVPLSSFLYHGRRNHFSSWLCVHGAHALANELRSIVGDGEPLRQEMLVILDNYM